MRLLRTPGQVDDAYLARLTTVLVTSLNAVITG